ncbi:hypothetical protein AC579_5361 [Pseudocercospora musae]|uniref:Uncharacterized protein n=1 Tax=Pseudocercospora musae TaxID=113226 RepID=A0A139ITB5_9PEZI|nr:hypothetical protein AC579_5361 [Pseudocercospora musae]
MWPFSWIFGDRPKEDNLDWEPEQDVPVDGIPDATQDHTEDEPVDDQVDVISTKELIDGSPVKGVVESDENDEPFFSIEIPETGEDEDFGSIPDIPSWHSRAKTIMTIYRDVFRTLRQAGWTSTDSWMLVSSFFDQAKRDLLYGKTRKTTPGLTQRVLDAAEDEDWKLKYCDDLKRQYLARLYEEVEPSYLAHKLSMLYARRLDEGWDVHLLNAILRRCALKERDPDDAFNVFQEEISWDAENALFTWVPELQRLISPEWTNDELAPPPAGRTLWHPLFTELDDEVEKRHDTMHSNIIQAFAGELLWLHRRNVSPVDAFNIVYHVWNEHFSNAEDEYYQDHEPCANLIRMLNRPGEEQHKPEIAWVELDLEEAVYKLVPRDEKPAVREAFAELLSRGFNVQYLLQVLRGYSLNANPVTAFLAYMDQLDPEEELFDWVKGLRELLDGPEDHSGDSGSSHSSSSSSSDDDGGDVEIYRNQEECSSKSTSRSYETATASPASRRSYYTGQESPSSKTSRSPIPEKTPSTEKRPSPRRRRRRSPSPAESYIRLPSDSPAPSHTSDRFLADFRHTAAKQFGKLFHDLRRRGWGPARAWRLVSVLAYYFIRMVPEDVLEDDEILSQFLWERSKDSTYFNEIFDAWRRQIYSPGGPVHNAAAGIFPPSVRDRFIRAVDAAIGRGMDLTQILNRWEAALSRTLSRPSNAVADLIEWLDLVDSPNDELFEWIPDFEEVWYSAEQEIDDETGESTLPEVSDHVDPPITPIDQLLSEIARAVADERRQDSSEEEDESHTDSQSNSSETDSDISDLISGSEDDDDHDDDVGGDAPDPAAIPDDAGDVEDSLPEENHGYPAYTGEPALNDNFRYDGNPLLYDERSYPTLAERFDYDAFSLSDFEAENVHNDDWNEGQDVLGVYQGNRDRDMGETQDFDRQHQDERELLALGPPGRPINLQSSRNNDFTWNDDLLDEAFRKTSNYETQPLPSDRTRHGQVIDTPMPDADAPESAEDEIVRSPRTPPLTPRASDIPIPDTPFAAQFNHSRCASSSRSAWKDPKIKKVEPLRYTNRLEQPRRLPNTPTKSHQPPSPRRKGRKENKCHACGRAFRTTKTKAKRVRGKGGGVEKVVAVEETQRRRRRSSRERKRPARFDID